MLFRYEKEYFGEVIRNNSDLLINLIDDILDLSRLESGNMQIIYEEKDLNDICRSCLDTISVNVPPEVKLKYEPEFEQLIIKTDEQRLQQILINFLNNASKFTQTGSISLSYRLNRDENFIDISVTDTGCGIPEEKKDIIFERFAKVDEFSQGTGLGLPICKLISNLMGGKVFIDENYTEGARFTMRHP